MRPLLVALCFAAALAFCACGGGVDRGDEAQIKTTIVAAAFNQDPAKCRRFDTLRMLEQTYKARGTAALVGCERGLAKGRATPGGVEVTRIEAGDNRATAQVDYADGHDYVGQVMTVALVKRDGRWLEDRITGFVDFDGDAVALELGREMLRQAESAADARVLACMVRQYAGLDDEEFEAMLLDPSPQPMEDLARPCEPHSEAA